MTSSRARVFLIWLLAAGLSGPVGIILHELGHYLAAVALGFEDVKLSYASIDYARAELVWYTLSSGFLAGANDIYPLNHLGIVAAAGPAVTSALILMSVCILAMSRTSGAIAAFCAGLALMAGVRSLTGVYYMLYVRPNFPGARPFFDEINAARAFDIPVDWIAWPSAGLVVLAWLIVIPKLTPDRGIKLAAAVIGPILGFIIWGQIGPFVLP